MSCRFFLFLNIGFSFLMGGWQTVTAGDTETKPESLLVYIGTYTQGESEGIYQYRLNMKTGEMTPAGVTKDVVNPSFLAIHPDKQYLYAVNETQEYKGQESGAISAFSIDQKTGALTLLNQRPTQGGAPCHLVVDKAGKHVLVANYFGGNVIVFPVSKTGKLKKPSSVVQHKGSSVTPRQHQPLAHSINLDGANNFACVADLGLDKVMIYKYDAKTGTLTANEPASLSAKPAAGPRHFVFHPSGKFAYVINEMNSTVTAMNWDAKKGSLTEMQTLPTKPVDFKPHNSTAEVQIDPSGKFLYGSNRGHDSLAIFSIDQKTGKLTFIENQSTLGKTPRNFKIDPTGNYLLAANQNSSNVVVFRRDQVTGKLTPTGIEVKVPNPVCIKFLSLD